MAIFSQTSAGLSAVTPRLRYRPDIDGLRAIAVLSVVLFHLENWNLLPGGFFGVDIFFVISGFLIGTLIFQRLTVSSFRFSNFYLARLRRLFPAFATVLTITSAVAAIGLMSEPLKEYSRGLAASLAGVSNYYFAETNDYWGEGASRMPLIHTWSLSVEEQFYLLIPITLFLLFKLKKSLVLPVLVALGAVSFAFAIHLSGTNPDLSFYLLFSRAWELLTGVVLGIGLSKYQVKLSRTFSTVLGAVGIVLIGVSVLYLGVFTRAPSFLYMVPVAGTALLLLAGTEENPVTKLLSGRFLQFLGKISYSLYLWHYPLLALPRAIFGGLSPFQEAGAVLLAFFASVATYFLIEQPARLVWSKAQLLRFTAVFASLLAMFVGLILVTDGFRIRETGLTYGSTPDDSSRFGNTITDTGFESPNNLILLGDSHMQYLGPQLERSASARGYRFASSTFNYCPFLLGANLLEENTARSSGCSADFQEDRLQWVNSFGPSVVVVGGRLPRYLNGTVFNNLEGGIEPTVSKKMFRANDSSQLAGSSQEEIVTDGSSRAITALLHAGHTVVLIYPIPEVGWDVNQEIFLRGVYGPGHWPLKEPVSTSQQTYLDRSESTVEVFDSFVSDRILRFYPANLFCNAELGGRCLSHSSEEVFYSDSNHPSEAGSRLIVEEFWRVIGKESSALLLATEKGADITKSAQSFGHGEP